DPSRVGVAGSSQGGAHAWMAAAWSGSICDDDDPGFGFFPAIRAVSAEDYAPGFADVVAPDASAVSFSCAPFFTLPITFEPSFLATVSSALAALDAPALHALFAAPPRDETSRLANSTVAVLHQQAFDDRLFPAGGAVAALAGLNASAARAATFHTGGHGSAEVEAERTLRESRRRAFLDAHLLGLGGDAATHARIRWSAAPATTAEALDPDALWAWRAAQTWPTGRATPMRFWLENTSLGASPPSPGAAGRAVFHAAGTAPVAGPPPSIVWTGAPFATDVECAGSFVAVLELDPDAAPWQATLSLGVDEGGVFRHVASGFVAERGPGATAHGPRTVTSDPFAFRFPAGSTPLLRLSVTSERFDAPGVPGVLRVFPEPAPFGVEIRSDAPKPSWIDLPAAGQPLDSAALFVDRAAVSCQVAGDVHFLFLGGAAAPGADFAIGLSLSGASPGMSFGAHVVPLNPDALTAMMGWTPGPPFYGFYGAVDATARTVARLDLGPGPLPASLAGLVITAAGACFDAGGVIAATQPAAFVLTP
ncbi:MAG TPA: hypothetical protein VEI02_01610, partial [Planctomycetota bacterium]|nr:hypothetical protein [Planctomycetota bacterium]